MNYDDPARKLGDEIILQIEKDFKTAFSLFAETEIESRKSERKLYYLISAMQLVIYIGITIVSFAPGSASDKAVSYLHWLVIVNTFFFGLLFWQVYKLVKIYHEKNRTKRVR